ncbi:MAG TPA: tetratricopeptide repeat protein [Ignavibacteriaceae bacterium]|nr:tetratricopeptide repeat protein [Ignavibacteriaceae bacterium]
MSSSKNKNNKIPVKLSIDNKEKEKAPSPRLKKIFYLILILIPILFFVLLEAGLRLFNYGVDTAQWVDLDNGKRVLNPQIAKRYFYTTGNAPVSIQDVFDQQKKSNSFRVFVMGESSAAGYPFMPLGSFSRYLNHRLELAYPDKTIEVVNVGLTAINSYTLRDLFPGILEQKPDLILIYTGHNEYYGALGVGSLESLGGSRFLTNLILNLSKFKTIQLLRSIISGASSAISSGSNAPSDGTLMSRIAKDQYILYSSDTYYKGIEQFKGNMADMLGLANEEKVPVMIGTLVSNIKDQKPFISLDNPKPTAKDVFSKATEVYQQGKYKEANKLFKLAKDLDVLRFRAPEKMNEVIYQLGKEYKAYVVDLNTELENVSPNNIIGDNIMTDHLHPTLAGYQLMGKSFYEHMNKAGLLPKDKPLIDFTKQDSLTRATFVFSPLDSTIADFRIKMLKNDFPYVTKESKKPTSEILSQNNITDSIAYSFLTEGWNWEKAHREILNIYLTRNEFEKVITEINVLIEQYPLIKDYYNFIINELLVRNRYDDALKYCYKSYKVAPDAYNTKWIGIISLSQNKVDNAIKYLEESLNIDNMDAQALYNLAGAYINKKNYKRANDLLDRCLNVNPNYQEAKQLKQQLLSIKY